MANETKKNLQITIEDAKQLIKTNPFLKYSLEELFPELRNKSWEDLELIEGFYLKNNSEIIYTAEQPTFITNKNIFATESQAKSALAYAQLTQLMKDTGDCEGIKFKNDNKKKYIIFRDEDSLRSKYCYQEHYPIAFLTESVRDEFLNKHEELLNQYFQITK